MISIASALAKITDVLGTNVETQFTQPKKLVALTYARDEIIKLVRPDSADAPDTTITFSSRKASLPSDYLTWKKLWTGDTVFRYRNKNNFDHSAGDFFCVKIDTDGTEKIFVASDVSTALSFRYVKEQDPITEASGNIQLNIALIDALARFAAFDLKFKAQRDDAPAMYQSAIEVMNNAVAFIKSQESSPEEQRLQSVFESDTPLFPHDVGYSNNRLF